MGIFAKVNGEWRSVDGEASGGAPGAAVILDAQGATKTEDVEIEGVTYDIYEWTTAGVQHSLSVDEGGGLVDLLMIGGGGGGAGGNGGGGGAGGYLRKDNVYLPEGQHNVWVGRGGAGSPKNSGHAYSGEGSAIGGIYAAPGGGAGGRPSGVNGHAGGSGGGSGSSAQGGLGTQGFGHNGAANPGGGGGGGGAGGAGSRGTGGPGLTDNINGTDVERAKGGRDNRNAPEDGPANTGTGGGGGTYGDNRGGNGGTGLIILRVQK
jgi:hypothetical protein